MSKPSGRLRCWVLQASAHCSCRLESIRTVSGGHNSGSVVHTVRAGILRKSRSSRDPECYFMTESQTGGQIISPVEAGFYIDFRAPVRLHTLHLEPALFNLGHYKKQLLQF